MTEKSAFDFGKFVPSFDFLQSLTQSASKTSPVGGGIPGMANWVAPTLSVEELDKRIQELKTVQFWLEQNGTALKATIQALEVQKMTLSTLQGMNVNMSELAKAFTAKAPVSASTPVPEPQPDVPPSASEAAASTPPKADAPKAKTRKTRSSNASPTPGVDPMQWWGSLTQQFQNIASAAMQDAAGQAMKAPAGTGNKRPKAAGGSTASRSSKPRAKKSSS